VTPSLTTALTLLPPHLLLFLIPGPRPPRPPRPPTTPSLTPSRTRLSTLSPSQAVPSCVRPETCPHPQPCTGPSPFLLPISHWPQKTMPPAFPELGIDLMSNPCPSTLFHTKNPTVLRLLGSFPPHLCFVPADYGCIAPTLPPSTPFTAFWPALPATSKPLDLSRVAHCHPPSSFHHRKFLLFSGLQVGRFDH